VNGDRLYTENSENGMMNTDEPVYYGKSGEANIVDHLLTRPHITVWVD